MKTAIKVSAILIALLAGFFANTFFAKPDNTAFVPSADNACFLSSSPCVQDQVTMTLSQDSPHALTPITLTVNWPSSQSSTLNLSLSGLEMNMGNPMFKLKQIKNGEYQGTIVLPACTLNSMTWLGKLTDGTHTVYPAIRTTR
ncbi:hypothetical protein M9194_10055 [Vibrio sp. S4M6]|uniref:hypothetical protein n=1 Tax=Vibrio sinus TaxID=2946865 RepID=UPI00202AA6BB|nr:hypothetical protein [Vibrio sinus]MCL9781769.1 hypothetical protein [Vibrio sinus]